MANVGKGAVTGGAIGGTAGSAVPVLGTAVGTAVGAIVGTVTSLVSNLFASKKHYHLYYFEESDNTWKFVMDGHPSQVNPAAKQYTAAGIHTAIVRNKDDKAADGTLAPTEPPTGHASVSKVGSTNFLMIAALIAVVGIAVYFLFIRKKRK